MKKVTDTVQIRSLKIYEVTRVTYPAFAGGRLPVAVNGSLYSQAGGAWMIYEYHLPDANDAIKQLMCDLPLHASVFCMNMYAFMWTDKCMYT